jgi:SAM-dependent methyltransferase
LNAIEVECQTLRLAVSDAVLDHEEELWWSRFGDVENRFLWVQTPRIQRKLRGHYLKQITRLARPDAPIAELGCGVGWLCIQLGKLGARAIGIDFSDAQIQIAKEEAERAGVSEKVQFETADSSWFDNTTSRFSLVIMHGFLHHLSQQEIRQSLIAAKRVLEPGGTLVIFEPVEYPPPDTTPPRRQAWYLRWLRRLAAFHLRFQGIGLRKIKEAEAKARELIASRDVGIPPRGPSPKEMPFKPGELPGYLEEEFEITQHRRVLAMSHVVAKENLLMGLSQPLIARIIRWPILTLAAWIDRRLIKTEPPPSGMWLFEMWTCTART